MAEPSLHFKPDIPILKGESNLQNWDNILRRTLQIMDLEDHLLGTAEFPVPETIMQPTPEEARAEKDFRRDRAKVGLLLCNTLLDPHIDQLLEANGWDRNEKDPYVTYTLVKVAVTKTTPENTGDLVQEYVSLNRKNFDSLHNYQKRLQALRKRVVDLNKGLPANSEIHLWLALNGLKDVYPNEHRFWVRDMGKEELKWDALMSQLAGMANKETQKKAMVNLQGKAKSSDNGNSAPAAPSNNNNSNPGKKNQERGTCPECNSSISKGWKHHTPCGKHNPENASFCWWCEPTKAPDTWRNKSEAIQRLSKRAGSTPTGVLSTNSSGILHPSNLLFQESFRGTEGENNNSSFATIDLSTLDIRSKKKSGFRTGPQRS